MTLSRSQGWWVLGISVLVVAVLAVTVARGQADKWYPSRWGAADQRGAANRITPAKVLEAKEMIRTGTLYQLGHVYEPGMPMFGTRHFSLASVARSLRQFAVRAPRIHSSKRLKLRRPTVPFSSSTEDTAPIIQLFMRSQMV